MDKKAARRRRAQRTRARIRGQALHRLSVFRSTKHIYAQIFESSGERVVASASSLEKGLLEGAANGGNVSAAALVGKAIAERGREAGVEAVAFDRSGFKYHGRVKALADAAREHGLKF